MNPALPLLALLCLGGWALARLLPRRFEFDRAGLAVAWAVVGMAGMALLAPALWRPDGVPSPSGSLAASAPWQDAESSGASSTPAGLATPAGNPELVDVTFQVEPWLLYLRRELRAGRLPLWNPHQSSGAPYWSNGSAAPLFPLHLLFAALPLQIGFVLLPWLRILIGGLGCWWLARELGLGRHGALLAALIYPLSGRLTSFLLFPMGNALCLVPWVFLAIERLVDRRRGWRALALVGGLQLLAGHPETPVLTGLAGGVYLLVRSPPGLRQQARCMARYAAGWGAALLLAAVQLLPLAFYLVETSRWHEWDPGPVTPLAVTFGLLLRFFLPDLFGHAVDGSWWGPFSYVPTTVYAGALTIPLAAAAVALARHDRRWRGLLVCLLFCLAGAYHLPGMRQLLQALPVIGKGLHHYLLLAVELGLALLAGAGLERWRRGDGRRGLWAGTALSLAAVAAAWVLFAGDWAAHDQLRRQFAWSLAVLVPVIALAASCFLAPALRPRLVPVLLLLVGVDLVAAHGRTNPGLALARLYPRTPVIEQLAERPERLVAIGSTLRPNAAMVYGLYDIRGDDSLKLRHYERLYGGELASPHPTFFRPLRAWRSPWLDRLAVRWVVAPPGRAAPVEGWREVWRGPDAVLFERPGALPLVRWEAAGSGGSVEVEERRPGFWRLAWSHRAVGRLVIAECWAPGWRAEQDGRQLSIERIDGVLMALRLGPGEGVVTLRYRPPGLPAGVAITLVAGLLLLVPRWRR